MPAYLAETVQIVLNIMVALKLMVGKMMNRNKTPQAASSTEKRLYSRMSSLLLAGMFGYGITAGALVAGALAASVLPAQAPRAQSHLVMIKTGAQSAPASQTIPSPAISSAQPMPPMPAQAYDAQFHEGSVALNSDTSFAGIDPFITGPVPK